MHPRYKRLLEAAKTLKQAESPADVARLLNVSDQVITNWKSRGVPDDKITKVARILGCHPYWLEDGEGDMVYDNLLEPDLKAAMLLMQPMPDYGKKAAIKEITQVAELITQAQAAGQKK